MPTLSQKFPDESCTGVPAGYALTTVTGDLTTATDGQVIDGKDIAGDLIVKHKRVTVTRSRVKGRVDASGDTGLVLRDVDLGPDACPKANNGGNRLITANSGYTLIRGHLHNNGDDVLRAGGGDPIVIQDSLIHHTCYYPNDHLDALQFYDPGGVGHVTVAHSVLDVRPVNSTDLSNAAIFWADTPGAGSTLTIFESLLAGGGVTLAAYDSGAGSGVTVNVHDTRFVRNSFDVAACGLGGIDAKNHSPTIPFNGKEGLEWQANAYDDGTPLPTCQ